MEIAGKRIVVLGAGISGLAAARLACRQGALTELWDGGDSPELRMRTSELSKEGIDLRLGWKPEDEQGRARPALAVVSPGIAPGSTMGKWLTDNGVDAVSELEFGAGFCSAPLLAVTGTNGKTTTVELLTHVLATAGKRVSGGGNIGLPLSQLALSGENFDFIVAEVSSFQMETTRDLSPLAAALLNVTPDHLSRHGSMEEYLRLKLELLRQVKPEGSLVVNASLLSNPQVAGTLAGRRCLTFSASEPADFQYEDGYLCRRLADGSLERRLAVSELQIRGRHNWENALAVMAMCEAAGVLPEEILDGLKSFRTGEHRQALVGIFDGVTYINDSKGTNVDALVQALKAFGEEKGKKIILIAGGIDKGCDLVEAKNDLRMYVKEVFLIGSCRERLVRNWGDVVKVQACDSLAEAVKGASSAARPGDLVMLCPACASQDMFRDYIDRGKQFEELVRNLQSPARGN